MTNETARHTPTPESLREAAPAMYGALQQLLFALDLELRGPLRQYRGAYAPLIAAARAALAKAEGRS